MRMMIPRILLALVGLTIASTAHAAISSDSTFNSMPTKTVGAPAYSVGDVREFWAWDLSVMPPGARRVEATAIAVGPNSYVFVDKASWDSGVIDSRFAMDLYTRLESHGLPSAIDPSSGIMPLQQRIFGNLPGVVNPDRRVVILLLDMGEFNGHRFDGYFNPFDQMKQAEAQTHGQNSNEQNIIYLDINPNGPNSSHNIASIITHELQHLLSHHKLPNFQQDSWLSETSAEAAMMYSGYFTDQRAIDGFSMATWNVPLVTTSYVNYGVSAAFAAFLIDKLGGYGGFDYMMYIALPSREAVERAHYVRTGRNTSFDAIFSEFITYLYLASNTNEFLPKTWTHLNHDGYWIPPIERASTINQIPFEFTGSIRPYSFAVFELERELPPLSSITVEILPGSGSPLPGIVPRDPLPNSNNCKDDVQVLWKPLPNAIAVYAVGCKYGDKRDQLRYKLSIRD